MERNMDESRKQFEEWVLQQNKTRLTPVDNPLKRYLHGYHYGWVDAFWEAWQASRAAIEIELPDVEDPANFFCEVYDTYKVQRAINSAGIKIKGA